MASDAVRRSGFPVIRDVIEAGGLPIGLPDATRRAAMVKVRRVEADITTVSQKLSELPTWLWLLTRACLARRMDYLAGLMYPDESAPALEEFDRAIREAASKAFALAGPDVFADKIASEVFALLSVLRVHSFAGARVSLGPRFPSRPRWLPPLPGILLPRTNG